MNEIQYRDNQDKILSSNTYDGLFYFDEKEGFHLNIFSSTKPVVKDGNLLFLTGQVSPLVLGITDSAVEIVRLWEKYERDGFPMEDLGQSFYVTELLSYFQTKILPSITPISDLILLIHSMERCSNIKGFKDKFSRDKRKIQEIIQSRNMNPRDLKSNLTVCEKISHIENEYLIAYHLNIVTPVEFTADKGIPDLKIVGKNILIDTKMRYVNDKPIIYNTEEIKMTIKTVFSLLMKDGFSPLERAFDKQNADIAMINLSKTAYGLTLGTGLITDISFKSTIESALNMAQNNEKVVIFYNYSMGKDKNIYAVCFKRNVVEDIGRNLDKIDKLLIKSSNKMNFAQFAYLVNNMNNDSFRKELGIA